jgi:hypothetical protein
VLLVVAVPSWVVPSNTVTVLLAWDRPLSVTTSTLIVLLEM